MKSSQFIVWVLFCYLNIITVSQSQLNTLPGMILSNENSINIPSNLIVNGVNILETLSSLQAMIVSQASLIQALQNRTASVSMRVSKSSAQVVPPDVWTKITFENKIFDTTGSFDFTLNRFFPKVPGTYFVQASLLMGLWSNSATPFYHDLAIYKNGGEERLSYGFFVGGGGDNNSNQVTELVQMNGISDYLEIYIFQEDTSSNTMPIEVEQAQQFMACRVDN